MYILYIICADDTIFIFRMSTDDRSLQRSSGISINESAQDDGNIRVFNNVYTVADISISTKIPSSTESPLYKKTIVLLLQIQDL